MTDRPEWRHADKISEDDARWFAHNSVVGMNYRWEYRTIDSVNEWYELLVRDNRPGMPENRVGRTISVIPACVSFNRQPSGNRGMLQLAAWIADDVHKLDKYDKDHATEIAEYERLRVKLGR